MAGSLSQGALVLEARAKVNLSLDITGRREDGYHLVRMVLQSINLADRLALSVMAEVSAVTGVAMTGAAERTVPVRLTVDDPTVPTGTSNLVVRAAEALTRHLFPGSGWLDRLPAVEARLAKRIPVGAGLGGGSADAAASLRGLCQLWGLTPSEEELMAVGLEVGADVPFCLEGGTRLVGGIGEILRPVRRARTYWFVLANPGFPVSTGRIYAEFDVLEAAGVNFPRPDNEKLTAALEAGDGPERLGMYMANVLEPATLKLYPELTVLRDKLRESGLYGVMMSGSGPTWLGLAEDEKQVAESLHWLRSHLPREVKLYQCTTVDEGVVVKSSAGG